MASTFSFDIVSDFDAAEMNNTLDQTKRELNGRYDFKGTSASIDWLDGDKSGFKLTGDHEYQLDAIIDTIRKKAATRGISQKVFDVSQAPTENNLKMTKEIPFIKGLDQEKAKKITKQIRDAYPKVKTQIQGEEVRVTSAKKDELQSVMTLLRGTDFNFPVEFTNFR